ncbi:MAG TPA: chemotaxis protein CheB [Tepidisphaeraceae bacterium]|nr:chemotaxis protein CheB [Tepidisphaeraceae bacterium]
MAEEEQLKEQQPAAPIPPDLEPDRMAEPLDWDQPPRLAFPVVGIGASAGGLEAASEFFKVMPSDSGMAFVLIQHLPPQRESMLCEILARRTDMPVHEVTQNLEIQANHLYVIRPGFTLTIKDGRLHLGEPLEKPGHRRPVDDFFRSLAEEQRERAIAIVLSGMGSNGTAGAQAIKAVGGLCIAQDPETAQFPSMARSLIDSGLADFVLKPAEMPDRIQQFAGHPYVAEPTSAQQILERERTSLNEVLAVLRTRTRQDLSGYKKPTILRRIQRRMGLNQVTRLAEYVQLLRQRPGEATALSDDILIHITGFFRDAAAWENLSTRVIDPMIRNRDDDAPVRVWVTACSSGEEAYTLAMLIAEAMGSFGKHIDVKIFATDTAERTLGHARAGVYPNGIESEISAQRLERFFEKEDSVYRVKKELREMVVFAPQNVLRDPPFSRLDLVTCRNLLIYLEPEMQRRVLSLLHFGLRDGGTLFLGNSETITGLEDMFEPIDKKFRIYKRIGPTRHGEIEFPLPHILVRPDGDNGGGGNGGGNGGRLRPAMRGTQRASVEQMTQRALLDRYTPAAVVVDRQHRVVYYHGKTYRFLSQPTGEPTRDVLTLALEPIRGTLRAALHKISPGLTSPVVVRDGVVEIEGAQRRLEIHLTPIRQRADPAQFFLISFIDLPVEHALSSGDGNGNGNGDGNGNGNGATVTGAGGDVRRLEEELARVRDELQSTIEELQSSNEEMKASNEEITSVNEELQSTNEELETSKEELQSLNEELTTVNAQLHAKMEELESTTNDLSSLLSSTDIPVLFLDAQFRIRRYTPPVRDLLELIPTDLGRPVSDLAHKFEDEDLLRDAQQVLDRLIPLDKEILSQSGRSYIRRVLPYRTTDNRINGVVVTFIDITDLRSTQRSLGVAEERRRLALEASGAGDWEYDPRERRFHLSPLVRNLMGMRTGEREEIDVLLNQIHPEDRPEVRAAIEAALDPRGSGIFRVDFRVARASNDFLWVEARGRATFTTDPANRQVAARMRGTMLEITDRKVAEQVLTSARRTAEAANEAKDEFLASISHELRTPLSTILLWTKMLRAGAHKSEELNEALRAIEYSAEAQKQLIEDLLDISRITAGKLRLDLRATDLAQLVRRAVETVRPAAESKALTIQTRIADDIGTVRVDPDRLQQVVWNLLINAVKFTPRGGRIELELQRADQSVRLCVTDSGVGLAPSLLPHLFEAFRQGEQSIAPADSTGELSMLQHGGLGLGLSIAKRLVEMHGGTITASSEGVGQGATFTIQLPLEAISAQEATPATKSAGPRSSAKREAATIKALQDNGGQAAQQLACANVLVVEDVPATRRALEALLQSAGATVTAVETAAAALKAYDQNRPDLIVCDIGLPDVDGFELLRQIRQIESDRGMEPVPGLALTAYTQEKDKRHAIQAGFQQHMSKPPDAVKLIAMLQAMLRQHGR